MDKEGSFYIKNFGKSSILVNSKEVHTGQSQRLHTNYLIEVWSYGSYHFLYFSSIYCLFLSSWVLTSRYSLCNRHSIVFQNKIIIPIYHIQSPRPRVICISFYFSFFVLAFNPVSVIGVYRHLYWLSFVVFICVCSCPCVVESFWFSAARIIVVTCQASQIMPNVQVSVICITTSIFIFCLSSG